MGRFDRSMRKKVSIITFSANVYYENIRMNHIESILATNGIEVNQVNIPKDAVISEALLMDICASTLVCICPTWIKASSDLLQAIKIRNPNVIVVFEQPNLDDTYLSLFTLEYAPDFIVLGHGGYSILEFLKEFNGTNMLELVSQSPYIISKESQSEKRFRGCDINDIPWKRHDVKFMQKYLFTHIDTSIGCLASCSFCGHVREKWSGRSPEAIVSELVRLEHRYNVRAFNFTDKSFEDPVNKGGKERFEHFCDLLIRSGKKFALTCYIRAESFKNNIDDKRLLLKAKQAGFVEFVIGIEAGNQLDLDLYNKRATLLDNYNILNLLADVGINAFYGYIMLNPYSTKETIRLNYEFLKEHKCAIPANYISFLFLGPSVPLTQRIKQDGLLSNDPRRPYVVRDETARNLYELIMDNFSNGELYNEMIKIQDKIRILDMMLFLLDDVIALKKKYRDVQEKAAMSYIAFFDEVYENWNFKNLENQNVLKKILYDHIQNLDSIILVAFKRYYRKYGGITI